MEEIMNEIKEKIEQIVAKLKADKTLLTRFKTQPVKVVEELIGIDLPDDKIQAVIDGVKAKMEIEDAKDKLDDAKDAIGGILKMFKK